MTDTSPLPVPAPVKLSEAASLLLFIAAGVPTLARSMNLERVNQSRKLRYRRQADWLEKHPTHPSELTFNADEFAKTLNACSSGERHCKLWLLNVWNPSYAQNQAWHFDLFAALCVLDSENRAALAEWMKEPLFP